MLLISQKDFETKNGQEKIVQMLHRLERQVHELEQKLNHMADRESAVERDIQSHKLTDD